MDSVRNMTKEQKIFKLRDKAYNCDTHSWGGFEIA